MRTHTRLIALLLFIPLLALLAGCASAPDLPPGAVEFATNGVGRILSALESAAAPEPAPAAAAEEAAPQVAPAAAAPEIAWKYGGFDGSRAVEDPATQIEFLHVTNDGLSYQWASSSLRPWGLDDNDAGAIAAAFYWDGSRWVGGKFDWISTSRTTRDFKNIHGGYHGWDPDAFFAAKRHAFCIVSKDGRRRTNLVED